MRYCLYGVVRVSGEFKSVEKTRLPTSSATRSVLIQRKAKTKLNLKCSAAAAAACLLFVYT